MATTLAVFWISKVCKHFTAFGFRIKLKGRRCTWLKQLKNRPQGVRNCKAAEQLFFSFILQSIILFGNLKVIILFTGVFFPDYLIPKIISDYLSIPFRETLMITVAKHVIILVIIRSLALTNCSKAFWSFPAVYLLSSRENNQRR
jgi:hypothetical protein